MQRPIGSQALSTLLLVSAAGVLAGSLALVLAADRVGDRFYLIRHEPNSWWLTLPQRDFHAKAVPISRRDPPRFRFEKSISLPEAPEQAPIRIRALRELALTVNGQAVPLADRDPRRWKRATELDLAPWLRPGENRIEAEVVHGEGPPLLQIRSDAVPALATTGRGWQVERLGGAGRVEAVVANDVRHVPDRDRLPVPAEVLRGRAIPLLLVFLVCAAPVALRVRAPAALSGPNLARLAFAAVTVFWVALYATTAPHMPSGVGFDSKGHLGYVKVLAEEGRLLRADDGWEAFHPPLYYAAGAGLRTLSGAEPDSPLDRSLLRLLPMLAGLASAALAGRAARRLLPGSPGAAAVATLAAGLLPMHVLLSSFVSNESVHTFFASAALVVACDLLCATAAGAGRMASLSLLLGLALLTKSTTSLPLALLLPGVVAVKLWLVEARTAGRAVGALAAMLGGVALLSGWFYLRNWQLFGDPFVSNLTAFVEWTYWIPPGFHTPAWFLGFGEVLAHPFFSSFHSYADGFYSSFWGDGYASGAASVQYPHRWWDYDSMATVYLLALPATGLLFFGFARGAWQIARGDDAGRRLALATLWLAAFGMALMLLLATLRIPFNAMPKAFYTLPSLVSLAVAFTLGVDGVARLGSGAGRQLVRSALAGYGGVLVLSIVASFLR